MANEIGDRKLRDLKRKEVIDALERIAEGQIEGRTAKQLAGEVLVQAKRLWRFAAAREWIDASCIDVLTRADIDARAVRRNVVLRLDEVSGRGHLVHLASEAVEILEILHKKTGKKRHVFASPLRRNQPIFGRSVNNALGGMFKRGVLGSVTPCHVHDLRRTVITRLPDLEFEPFIGHKIANHVLPGVLGHYNHNEYLPQREAALKAWAQRIAALAGDRKVVQFQRPAA